MSPHNWLKHFEDYYEKIDNHNISLVKELDDFKKLIILQPVKIQCEIACEIILEYSLYDIWEVWRPKDWIVARRKIVRDTLLMKLLSTHKETFVTLPLSL